MNQQIEKDKIIVEIDLLIDNLVNLSDPTGEFSITVADGSVIDNKSFDYWEWTSGVGLYGLMKYYQLTRDKAVLERIVKWYDDRFKEKPVEKNINTMVQMLTLSYLYEETGDKKYIPYLQSWADWLYYRLPRTKLGAFQHVVFGDKNDNEMWIDTLMMSVLTLAKIGVLFKHSEYVEEAKKQFLLHVQFLQDKHSGLWYHGWNFNDNDNFGGAFWGRGNSWATIVIPEFIALLKLPEGDAIREFLLTSFKYQLDALKEYQDSETGLWHTLIDDPSSYLEGSATAGFTYGVLKGIHEHYVEPNNYREMADRGVSALLNNIDETGSLLKVSAGTPMGETKEFYKHIKISTMPYGQSMAILALTEYLRELY